MSRNKNRKPKQNGKGRASVRDASTDNNDGGAGASDAVWKGNKKTGAELFPNAGVAREPLPSEEEQMKWAMEASKRSFEATLQKTANIDEREDRDDDYWNKRQSNLPEAEAEKGGSAKPAEKRDDSREKRTTAGRIRDCPPGRSVMGRNNGNVENRVREIEASGVVRDKRFGDTFGRVERPPARGRGSGPREQQPQRRTSEFPRRHHHHQQQLVRQTADDVDEKLASLKNDDKSEVAVAAAAAAARGETRPKQPAEEKLRLMGFHSRSNRPSPDDEDSPIVPGDFSEKHETPPTTCGKIYNAPTGFPQIGNLASNPDSQRAYDQLAIYDPLLHRLLVQKHIDDQSSYALVDFENHHHYRQQLQEEEEGEEEEDREAMLQQQQSDVYGHSAPSGPSFVIVRLAHAGQPSQIVHLPPIDMLNLNLNALYYQTQQPPPMVGENQMENAIRMPVTPRGTAPSHRTRQQPSSRFSVPPAGRQQQQQPLPFSSGYPMVFRTMGPAPFTHHYGSFPQPNFVNRRNLPGPRGPESRERQPRLEPMPNVERLHR